MADGLRSEIISWNRRFPVDRWWRNKHNVAFNSSIHRESNFIDQLFEYSEEKMFEELREKIEYKPDTGDWLKKQERINDELSLIEEARREMMDLPDEI